MAAPTNAATPMPTLVAGRGLNADVHVIIVLPGENVLAKINSFLQQNAKRVVCIMSATGLVTAARLCKPGQNIMAEGLFDILSLTGNYFPIKNDYRAGNLCVVLSGPDFCVLGGSVFGILTAANTVKVVVQTFAHQEDDSSASRDGDNNPPKAEGDRDSDNATRDGDHNSPKAKRDRVSDITARAGDKSDNSSPKAKRDRDSGGMVTRSKSKLRMK